MLPRTLGALACAVATALTCAGAAQAAPRDYGSQRFRVTVKGVQTTTWSSASARTGRCGPGSTGRGTEQVTFASRTPVTLTIWRFGKRFVRVGEGIDGGELTVRATIARDGTKVVEPVPQDCLGTGGNTTPPPPPDCGTKRELNFLALRYEANARRPGLTLTTSATKTTGDPFDTCPVLGTSFPELLDAQGPGKPIVAAIGIADLFDAGIDKHIVIARGRETGAVPAPNASTRTTTVHWEVSLTRAS